MDGPKQRARALRVNDTQAENRLWQALRNRQLDGWKFRRQHAIDRYVVDFVAVAGKLIVEVDGGTHSTNAEISYDERRTHHLEALGFRAVRVSNRDVSENLAGVLATILSELKP